jgi:hypothetical protein
MESLGTQRKIKDAKETESVLSKVKDVAKSEGTYRKLQDGDRIKRYINEHTGI